MLLGDADVEIALGKQLLELHHARAFAHGGCDTDKAGILGCHVAQPMPKHLGEGLFGWRVGVLQSHGGVKLAGTVVGHRISLRQFVTLPFFGHHMQKLGALQMFDVFQRGNQGVQIMPINRADVIEAKLLKQRGRCHHAFGGFLKPLGQLKQGRRAFEHRFASVFGGGIKLTAHELGQVAIQSTHRRADAHVVVVQNNQ